LEACDASEGYVADNADCDDTRDDVNPAATEICDGIDNDCNGTADAEDGLLCTVEITSDGSEALPYCTWADSPCVWDMAIQEECAQKLCEASGYGTGSFVSGNDFCASDADITSDKKAWYWVVDKDIYEFMDYYKESIVTAACE